MGNMGTSRRSAGHGWPLVVAALALWPVLASAGSWWNDDWKFRKEVSFDLSPTGAAIDATLQDVPVLVRLSLANFNFFGDAKPDGSDFRVLGGDDKTPLKFHFERYDSQAQMAFLWVRVPQLSAGAKTDKIYVYYGNSGAPAGADVAGSYDVNETLVLHLAEATGLPQDSTAYKNNPTASNAEAVPASLIAGGLKFAGGQSLTVPASASLRLLPTQGFSASAWVKAEQGAGEQTVLALADQGRELVLGLQGPRAFARFAGGGAPVTVQASTDLGADGWHHLAVTAGAGQLKLYVDGELAASAAVTLAEIGGTLSVGSGAKGAAPFHGEIDEVETAKVARGAEWFKAAAKSQGVESPLVVYGADAQKEGGQGSYFGTILKNLTVDGWVVIGICMAMLVIAVLIMVWKAFYLSKVEGANRRFMAEFRRIQGLSAELDQPEGEEGADAAFGEALASGGRFDASTTYQLYHIAIAELNKRINPASGRPPGQPLSDQSVEAIRASVDAVGTRLQQQLSSQMVLLTIAISGGPFLGLLGTVIGVMITFAAIAASGDVNVNAIAPGTAAALAATVAGLSVAIPSLFGYNWLNTRIKSIVADQRVFSDELIARLAELHS